MRSEISWIVRETSDSQLLRGPPRATRTSTGLGTATRGAWNKDLAPERDTGSWLSIENPAPQISLPLSPGCLVSEFGVRLKPPMVNKWAQHDEIVIGRARSQGGSLR